MTTIKSRMFGLLLLGVVLSTVSAGQDHLLQSRPELIWMFDTEG
jgi:hypothetical protein